MDIVACKLAAISKLLELLKTPEYNQFDYRGEVAEWLKALPC